ncbi:MAG: glycerophosphodiester phosphodiesterase [Bacteroidetes bacterium]|nr:glycerophosphodiester phosphodiesterase [Bacteroidota bacterium]
MFRRKLLIGISVLLGLFLIAHVYNLDLMHKENPRDFPLVIAHRGASGIAPENTLASIQKALEMKVDMVEIDVHLSQDEEVIVIHDATLDRTTNGTGAVKDKLLSEIKTLDAGSWKDPQFVNEPVPTLSDVMEKINGQAVVLIEIKQGEEGRYPGLEQKVIEIIDQFDARSWSIIQSFETETVAEAIRLGGGIEVQKLISGTLPTLPFHVDKGFVWGSPLGYENIAAINPHFKSLTPRFVNQVHEKGLKVFTWTVNEKEEMEEVIGLGVDGIITNYPDRLIGIRDGK